MDSFDTDSNHSRTESIISNASSLSGLSLYGNEFAELRHFIHPNKYPTPHLHRSFTPTVQSYDFDHEAQVNILRKKLQKSLELNEQYKNDLQSLEKQMKSKCSFEIDQLIKNNTRLEGELEKANEQIERIIKNNRDNNEFIVAKQKIKLEKTIHELSCTNSNLNIECANLHHEKLKLDSENKNLKISLAELITENKLKNASIQTLKQKISDQHIELLNCSKSIGILKKQLYNKSIKLQEVEKSKDWYKNELHQCQNNLHKSNKEAWELQNKISSLNTRISSLNVDVSRYKNEVDKVRLQSLQEKEELFKKLEIINLDCKCLNSVPLLEDTDLVSSGNVSSENNIRFYEIAIEDLKGEIARIQANIQVRENEHHELKQENSELIAKCMVLQKTIHLTHNSLEVVENSKRELMTQLEDLKQSKKDNITENLQLKNNIIELELELNVRNKEKQSIENTIKVIRDQVLKFKESHEKLTNEVNLKNKDILLLQKQKQELFMSNNWTTCELEKLKQKDLVIEKLEKTIANKEENISEQTQKINELQIEIDTRNKLITEKELAYIEKVKELENYDNVILQYKSLSSDFENKVSCLQQRLKETEHEKNDFKENFEAIKMKLKDKDLELDKALKNFSQYKISQKEILNEMTIKTNQLRDNYNILQETCNTKLEEKDTCVGDLNKIDKLEGVCEKNIQRITDDEKAQIFLNHKNSDEKGFKDAAGDFIGEQNLNLLGSQHNFEPLLKKVLDNLNIEELENTVQIRLRFLDEKLQKIRMTIEERIKRQLQCGEEKIKELKVLLQVKNKDLRERQKKMDRNNRTLLRKVKEHMRGRNCAEKQLKFVQDNYNSLFEEHNTLKLSLSSKKYQIKALEKLCDDYRSEKDRLKSAVSALEKASAKKEVCERCLEVNHMREKFLVLEELTGLNTVPQNKLRRSEENVLHLTNTVTEKETLNKRIEDSNNMLLARHDEYVNFPSEYKDFENRFLIQSNIVQNLTQKLTGKEDKCCEKDIVMERLKLELEQAMDKVKNLSSEMKILSSNLQQKAECLEELSQKEKELKFENKENQNIISHLKQSVDYLQNEVDILGRDKFFLRRLSNDLKVALKSYIEYNKNLKEQLDLVTREKPLFSNLSSNILQNTMSGKYTETYINQLLEENSNQAKNPLKIEIQDCLSKLREDIFTLQDQIIKKNNRIN